MYMWEQQPSKWFLFLSLSHSFFCCCWIISYFFVSGYLYLFLEVSKCFHIVIVSMFYLRRKFEYPKNLNEQNFHMHLWLDLLCGHNARLRSILELKKILYRKIIKVTLLQTAMMSTTKTIQYYTKNIIVSSYLFAHAQLFSVQFH